MTHYDPNGVGVTQGGIFGLPYTPDDADTIIIPVPWDVTTSGKPGTHIGPQAILEASPQLDVYHPDVEAIWTHSIAMLPVSADWIEKNQYYRQKAQVIIDTLEAGDALSDHPQLEQDLHEINHACDALHRWIEDTATDALKQGKRVLMVGGEHSVSLGIIKAMATHHDAFGILQIDAHMDLRDAYLGFTHSHASVMRHAIQIPQVTNLIQVGIRDYCQQEHDDAVASPKVGTFFDRDLKAQQFEGITWNAQCEAIVHSLPDKVYVTIDVDGLDPSLCPHTGTPVPGGLRFEALCYLLKQLRDSGKTLIGGDVVEVSSGEDSLDGQVGARVLLEVHASLCHSR